MTPEQKIIAIAEWEGWKEVDSPNPQFRRLLNNSGKLVGSTEPERMRDLWLWAIPPYLTSRDAICGAVARLGYLDKGKFVDHLISLDSMSTDSLTFNLILSTPTQLADALLLTLGYEI